MKKLLALAAIAGTLAVPAVASAGDGYGSQPGFNVALADTVCAGAAAFGEFGDYGDDFGINTLREDGEPRADGTATGLNNSSLCGNR